MTRERDLQIVTWWNADGLSRSQIAARLGWSLGRLSGEFKRIREERGHALNRRGKA